MSVAVIMALSGFLFAVQIKTKLNHRENVTIPNRRIEEVTSLLKDSEQKRQELEQRVVELQKQIINLKNSASEEQENGYLDEETITAFTPLSGTGLIITLDDTRANEGSDKNQIRVLIQNEDLLKVTNELFVAGAEAISLNEQRLLAHSEISAAGAAIVINKVRIAPPFIIKAIGNPDLMMEAIKRRGGVIEYLEFFGIDIDIRPQENILLSAYTGPLEFKHAMPNLESNPENY